MMVMVMVLVSVLLLYTAASVVYQLLLALAFLFIPDRGRGPAAGLRRYALVVPAHNEELLIADSCRNFLGLDYPADQRQVFIIADNCSDRTAERCRELPVTVLERNDTGLRGKGYALQWAFAQIPLDRFDAVLIVDADTMVEPQLLHELDDLLDRGARAIQVTISIPNRDESWFTEVISLSRIANDSLYHHAKAKLGLSAYLMGSGMCFTTALLRDHPWNAFSLSEDWEYFAGLIAQGIKIDFCSKAAVLQMESRSLKQATTQRLRWAKGRFFVVKRLGFRLLATGIGTGNWTMADASLALLFPNWSLQINLILLLLVLGLVLPLSPLRTVVLSASAAMLAVQAFILAVAIRLSGRPRAALAAVLRAPVFLVWKLVIDILSITGLYRGRSWVRTARHKPKEQSAGTAAEQ